MATSKSICINQCPGNEIRIISANLRGFRTNVGELTHSCILKNKADIVFIVETFLDDLVPTNYATISGYSTWFRKDRDSQGGGIALCYRNGMQIQVLDIPIPAGLEIMFFKLIDAKGRGTLCCGCYRPPKQGLRIIHYLTEQLDQLMTSLNCQKFLMVGDLNQHLIQLDFDQFCALYDLENHVSFPTHLSGSSLDPVVSDFPAHKINCLPLGFVGSSDHVAILSRIKFEMPKEETIERTIFAWEKTEWTNMRQDFASHDWNQILQDDIDIDLQVDGVTKTLLDHQNRYTPHKNWVSKSSDQPWFGPKCKEASDRKYKVWLRFKRRPTERNRNIHQAAVKNMEEVEKWAISHWEKDMKKKLCNRNVGDKEWWKLIKYKQGIQREENIPPLNLSNGSLAMKTHDKVDAFAQHFASKMKVTSPSLSPPHLPLLTQERLSHIFITEKEVYNLLRSLDEKKAVGPDGISPRLLRGCAKELAPPLTILFNNCIRAKRWPRLWKISQVVPVHKKGDKSDIKNYRPVSLLSVLSKILEKLIASRIQSHIEKHHLLSERQFGFRKHHSTADLHLLMSSEWEEALDKGKRVCVLTLDIEGAFDRVWHKGLSQKLEAFGIGGDLLQLLDCYLSDRKLKVVLEGKQSNEREIEAGVPQGSVLGPLMWNVFINDLLHLIPEAKAFADDGTISITYEPTQEKEAINLLNYRLKTIEEWGKRWQVNFAPNKTQLMIITRSAPNSVYVYFNGKQIQPVNEVIILGVTFDSQLTYKSHIENIARRASRKLAALRRIGWLLDEKDREILYKAQIRSVMEYSPLTWGGAAKKYLGLLDKIQARANNIIQDGDPHYNIQTKLQDLQHRRDVAGLTTFFKFQQHRVTHLDELARPLQRRERTTRRVEQIPTAVEVPFARTSHYQRCFLPAYSILWNNLLQHEEDVNEYSIHTFKCRVNKWLILVYDKANITLNS